MSRIYKDSAYAPLNTENDEDDREAQLIVSNYPPSHTSSKSRSPARHPRSLLSSRPVKAVLGLIAFGMILLGLSRYMAGSDAYTKAAFPSKISRLSTINRDIVYGVSNRVDVGNEYHTMMEFPVPSSSFSKCHFRLTLPYVSSIGSKTYESWGDVSEIEIWRIPSSSSSINWNTLSYDTRPSHIFSTGEPVGILDATQHPEIDSEEFECGDEETMNVYLRCLRKACKIVWLQDSQKPQLGLELIRG